MSQHRAPPRPRRPRPRRPLKTTVTSPRPGEQRLRETLRQRRRRIDKPRPDSDWGWAVEDRLARLEDGQKWILRLMVGGIVALVMETVIRGVGG